jgi:succinate dehydrogenase flavin-adding protein (antitoxin of CptAB toxin-antitoxin module)
MSTVWILEKWQTPEDSERIMNDFVKDFNNETDEEEKKHFEKIIAKHQKRMEENPNGYWYGWVGRSIYKQFCEDAIQSIRWNKKAQYRVLKAEVDDSDTTWLNYKNGVENKGVYKYLRAMV